MLMGQACPTCNGSLVMKQEGLCSCRSCNSEFDPTVVFQRCSNCGGKPVLRVRRYQCQQCSNGITSRFHFDGLVFDADYFRKKMSESRDRKQQQRERIRKILAESRSADLPIPAAYLETIPGLVDALNGLTADVTNVLPWLPQDGFDLNRYQNHIQAHLQDFPVAMEEIPALIENSRKDRIWRFIAIIFLAHFGLIKIWQEGQSIIVMKHETNRKRQNISGNIEGVDGLEGSLGGIEAW